MKLKTLSRTLPLATFEVVYQLLQQMAELPGAIWLGDHNLLAFQNAGEIPSERFAAVVSEQFSALVRGKQDELGTKQQQESEKNPNFLLNVELTFEPDAIANFLSPLADKLSAITPAFSLPIDIIALKQAIKNIQPNSVTVQSEFTLSLLEVLAVGSSSKSQQLVAELKTEIGEQLVAKIIASEMRSDYSTESVNHLHIPASFVSVCQPMEDALQKQLAQERLLNQVTTQIRQSLELPAILSKAVERVREFLEVDRLLIYQFEKLPLPNKNELKKEIFTPSFDCEELKENPGNYLYSGRVTYEALATPAISSVLNFTEGANCVHPGVMHREKYRKGLTFAIADVEKTYSSQPCFLELMRRVKVRAKLVVPIVVQEELWGQKRTLEQRVIEHTSELRDALGAAQSASLAKSEFLAAMSHELRTPLTCVIGISDTLLRCLMPNSLCPIRNS